MSRFSDFLPAEKWDEAAKPAEVTVEGCTKFCEREKWLERGCE